VANVLRHPDYSEIDNNCISQTNQTHRSFTQKEGLILYPLFDSNNRFMGILRQYFSQSGSKYIPQERLDKIKSLL
jgi:hypothetical protein